MPDLLLELFCEEIPARMQATAADNLRKLVTDALVERGLVYEGAKAFVTPRRLALAVHGLPAGQPDTHEERKGPRVGAPDAAIQGFLKAAGLSSIDEATIEADPKKGEFYVARIHKHGRPTPAVIADIVPEIVRTFPWPKSMRWGSGTLRWVRPLQSILCTFGPETEEPEVVRFEIDGLKSGDLTRGHRFLSEGEIKVRRLDDWMAKLEAAHVVVDRERRKDIILNDAKDLALAQGLELVEDPGLLEEIAGLVEWPVVLMGEFEERFLDIPDEVIRATIRANQKCFVLRDPKTGRLANRFVLVSNLVATDGGKAIVAGNGRVIRARLSDAKFFWDTDRKSTLESRLPKFANITFHEKLGSQAERIERIAKLARELAPAVGADPDLAEKAARLAKADLLTEVVGEFPEVQGLMGKYYARLEGLPEEIAAASEDHYKPQGPSDRVPTAPVSVAVALADKIDTLVGFWAIDEKPTGSKDPYALRRAALGVVRIILENGKKISLLPVFLSHFDRSPRSVDSAVEGFDLLSFIFERLKVQLRDQGARHDLVDAVLGVGQTVYHGGKVDLSSGSANPDLFGTYTNDVLLLVVRRVEALGRFLSTDDGKNLLAGYKRAANILRIEEKKDGVSYEGGVDATLLQEPEEKALAEAIASATPRIDEALAREDFEGAMGVIATLRAPVDAFFEKVTVNAPDAALRANRLRLLAAIRTATRAIADFERIEG